MRRAFLLIGLFLSVCPALRAVDFQKDDPVLFVRDEPLLLIDQPLLTAKKGQVYTVWSSQPETRRVYLLVKGPEGKTLCLNAPDFAVVLLPGRGEPAFQRGLNALKLGHWPDAERELAAAVAAEPDAVIYEQVRAAVGNVLGAQRGVQGAVAALEKARQLSAIKRRNANITEAGNALFPDDHSGPARAAVIRKEAAAIDAEAQAALTAAQTTLDHSATGFDAALLALADARVHDAVLALLDARGHLLPLRGPGTLGALAHPDLDAWQDLVASAYAATGGIERDLAANRLVAAEHEAAGGLVALPEDHVLRALQMQVQMRLAAVRDHEPEIDAAEKAGDFAGALRLVNAQLAESVDDPDLLRRKAALIARLGAS